jgi:hypothetical protein
VTTNVDKPDDEVRKFIRSHVMLGKNLGRTLPPRKKKHPSEHSQIFADPEDSAVMLPDEVLALSPASRQFSSVLSTISLADSVEPSNIDAILQCKCQTISMEPID